MKPLIHRVLALEADHAQRPMSEADEERHCVELWAMAQIIAAGRDLSACCIRKNDEPMTPSQLALIARLDPAADEDDREAGEEFIPLPDEELDRLADFLIERRGHHVRT